MYNKIFAPPQFWQNKAKFPDSTTIAGDLPDFGVCEGAISRFAANGDMRIHDAVRRRVLPASTPKRQAAESVWPTVDKPDDDILLQRMTSPQVAVMAT